MSYFHKKNGKRHFFVDFAALIWPLIYVPNRCRVGGEGV